MLPKFSVFVECINCVPKFDLNDSNQLEDEHQIDRCSAYICIDLVSLSQSSSKNIDDHMYAMKIENLQDADSRE
jgi:hypothetical protein